MADEPRPREPRANWLVPMLGIAAFGAVLALGAGALWILGSVSYFPPEMHADDVELARTQHRLDVLQLELARDLRSAGEPEPKVERTGCTTDSGDVFQPRLNATWTVPEGQAASGVRHVADVLEAGGWTTSPSDDGEVELVREHAGWRAHGYAYGDDGDLGATEPYVAIEITIVGAEPCSWF